MNHEWIILIANPLMNIYSCATCGIVKTSANTPLDCPLKPVFDGKKPYSIKEHTEHEWYEEFDAYTGIIYKKCKSCNKSKKILSQDEEDTCSITEEKELVKNDIYRDLLRLSDNIATLGGLIKDLRLMKQPMAVDFHAAYMINSLSIINPLLFSLLEKFKKINDEELY